MGLLGYSAGKSPRQFSLFQHPANRFESIMRKRKNTKTAKKLTLNRSAA
jgi:hypothetical protein